MSIKNINGIDVVVLCGGLGSRLKGVIGEIPKVMVKIGDRSFLDILIENISRFGFKRFVLCTGYKSDLIEKHYKDNNLGVDIVISKEKDLLGTGGAIKNAQELVNSDPFLVVNGDSSSGINIKDFLSFHLDKQALISIGLACISKSVDYGSISLGRDQRIVKFQEKQEQEGCIYINAGIYLVNKEALFLMPNFDKFSLEYDFFPKILDKKIYGYIGQGDFLDIGTPDRYQKVKRLKSF